MAFTEIVKVKLVLPRFRPPLLLPLHYHQCPEDQPVSLVTQHRRTTPVPTLHPQSLSNLAHYRGMEVWLQNRMAGRKASQVDLRFGSEFLVLNHDLAQEFGTETVHRRLAVLSVHQAAELFQLLQHVKLEVPFLTELHERFMKPVVLLQLFQGPHIPPSI